MKRVVSVVVLAALAAAPAPVGSRHADPADLVVHEWGTFSSIAGEDGTAVEWLPLEGGSDLPCFVERFRNVRSKGLIAGTVRMETPVLYFYAPGEMSIDVGVTFRQGLVTEWFPRAMVTPKTVTSDRALSAPGFVSSATWRGVRLSPGSAASFPQEAAASHYYAARRTKAAPLAVGTQAEKFLFYRGVGRFGIPLAATIGDAGTITVTTAPGTDLGTTILFEKRGGQIGYRIGRDVRGTVTLPPPVRGADLSDVTTALERELVSRGLYREEASAMLATWRDSWFEEGSRLFYIYPAGMIDELLPLDVRPRPAQVQRVFVGRVELLTPATLAEVQRAIAAGDLQSLAAFGRFLPTIVNRLYPVGRTAPADRTRAFRLIYAAMGPAAPRCG